MATCPLCSAAFAEAEPYRDHLEEAHGLRDDEGTATVTQLRATTPIEDEAAMSLVAEAMLDGPAPTPAPADAPPAPSPAATAPPAPAQVPVAAATSKKPAKPTTAAATAASGAPGGRYLLASRHGDVALYAPGLVMLLTAVVRLEADVLGLLFLVLGTALVVLGMLLPLVLGRR